MGIRHLFHPSVSPLFRIISITFAALFAHSIFINLLKPQTELCPTPLAPGAIKTYRIPASRLLNFHDSEIPRIIHQTYRDKNLPLKFKEWQKSCIDLHPNYEYRLWTDSDLRELVRTKASWLLQRYDGFENFINRVDVGRYLVLYLYGGFFIDLDVECLKSHERFVKMGGALLPQLELSVENEHISFPEHNIPNSWMASTPNNIFWMSMLQEIAAGTSQGVEQVTGSVFLYNHLFKWQKKTGEVPEVTLLYPGRALDIMPGTVFPYDWRQDEEKYGSICLAASPDFDPSLCKQKLAKYAYAITYWTKTWGDWRMEDHILHQPNK
ncbi:hypothetical protein HDV03_003618 [Kappamyces sp. JEL0829]|nr:hypothetical protein HDV03_003618 [Kappamyces sp. JEL0829]